MKKLKKIAVFVVVVVVTALWFGCSFEKEEGALTARDLTGSIGFGEDKKVPVVDTKSEFYQSAIDNVLRIGGGFEPPETLHANPLATSGMGNIEDFLYERLFDFVPLPEKTYFPVIGESFIEEADIITITLKDTVMWNDGMPFTSADVIGTFNIGFINNLPIWNYLESVVATGPYTVVLTFTQANAITTQLATNIIMNTPYHIYKEWMDSAAEVVANRKSGVGAARYSDATEDAKSKVRLSVQTFKPDVYEAVGTGPYKPKNITTAEAVLERNEYYYNQKNIKIDEIRLLRSTSQESLLNIIKSDGYDFENLGLSPDVYVQVVNSNPYMRVMMGSDLGQPSLQFNMKIAPMDNKLIRKAIQYIVERDILLLIAEPGSAQSDMTSSGMVPAMRDEFLSDEFVASLETYSYDVVKAEELLTMAGWSKNNNGKWVDENGRLVQLEFTTTSSYPTFFLCADAIVNQLNEFGILTTLKTLEVSAYWKHLQEQGSMMSVGMRPGSPNYGHPWEIYRSFFIDGAADLGFTTLVEKKAGITDIMVGLEDGTRVNTGVLLDELLNTTDALREQELIEYFALLVNDLAVSMPMVTKYIPQKIYNPYLTGFPEDGGDPLWYGGGSCKVAARLIREGQLYYSIPE